MVHREFEYLELEDLFMMIRRLDIGPICDVGLLDSAINRPRSRFYGEEAYATLSLKAAALLQSITKNHALTDGNKRLAWLSTVVFCDLNGYAPQLGDDDAFKLVYEIASSKLDVEEISQRLSLKPLI